MERFTHVVVVFLQPTRRLLLCFDCPENCMTLYMAFSCLIIKFDFNGEERKEGSPSTLQYKQEHVSVIKVRFPGSVTDVKNDRKCEGHILFKLSFMVVAVYGTLSDLLSVASSKLGIKATSVYNGKGGLIDDIALIRDDDVLFVCEGEPFIDPQTDSKLPEGLSGSHTDWLTLNVGGRYFTTTRSTLVNKEPDSMLAHMFKDKGVWGNKQDHRGAFLIDRSPEYFEPILNYLRHGQLIVNDGINLLGVLEEARFFGIDSLIEHLEVAIKNSQPPEDHSPISRKEFVRFLLATPTKSELRCQGLNFSGADLSRLDLRYINFKMANLSRCNLAHANLCCANLERADLSGSVLDNCDLSGCDLQEANLRGSNVKGAIFEEMLTPLHMSQSVR
ncbi:BTB/POZ domain-containing protein KCTD9 isoform X7 [Myotis myotis]|uniref:BTB/POZ domain-containing protein KCTD9 isoform X7 n=1 Tax=Myotis myotis TaxID=51298 RepID=UPI00174BD2C4|nr:BTB/POZ domain-containing protein KCTD9 isoform X7 [Myotis myotis]